MKLITLITTLTFKSLFRYSREAMGFYSRRKKILFICTLVCLTLFVAESVFADVLVAFLFRGKSDTMQYLINSVGKGAADFSKANNPYAYSNTMVSNVRACRTVSEMVSYMRWHDKVLIAVRIHILLYNDLFPI